MRSHTQILEDIKSFNPITEEEAPQRWPDWFALLDDLTAECGSASDANAELICILKDAPVLCMPVEDIVRLTEFDLNDDVMRARFLLFRKGPAGSRSSYAQHCP